MAQSYDEWKKSQGGGNSPQNSGSSGNEGASGVISYDEWKKSGSPQRYDGYSREIDSFAQDANNFFRMAQRDNSGEKRFNAADYFEERKKQADALKQRAANISRYLEDNANLYTPDYYDSLMQTLSTFDTEVDDVLSLYQPALDSRAGMRAYEDEFIAAQERNDRLRGLDKQALFSLDNSSPAYNLLESMMQYRNDESYRAVSDAWTDEERYTLGQLQREDPAKARDYAIQRNNYYNAQATKATRENIRQNAVANKGKSTAAALLASTFTAPGELADRLAENMARGTTTEKRYVTPTDYAQEITGAISHDLNQKHGTFDADEARRIRAELQNNVQGLVDNTGSGMNVATGKTGEFVYDMLDDKGRGDLYQVGYSIAQNALSRYTLGAMGGEAAVLANYFMNAATSGIDDARRAGASGNQAMLSGIVKGALEVATEVAPLDRLFKMGDAVTWGELFKNLGMEALLEAIGEGTNTALGYLADQKILGDASEYNRMVQEYVNQGMTEAQAKQRAFRDAAMNTAYDALTGAVSGIVSGGTETVGKTAQANLAYRNVDPRTLVDMGMGTAEGSKAYTMAQQMQEQLDNDQKISGNQKRVLGQNIQLQQLAEEKAAAEAAATEDLMELGQVENLEQLADLVARKSIGEDLSWKDKRTIRKNQNVQTLLSTMEESSSDSSSSASVPEASTFRRTTENTQVSKDGRAIQISTDNPVDVLDFASMDNGVATVQLNDGETAAYDDIAFKDQQQANQFYAVRSLPGLDTESANNLLHTIQDADAGKDIDSVVGIREAYAMGYYNQSESNLAKGDAAALTPELRKAVFDIGRQQNQAQEKIQPKAKAVTAKPTQGYKKITIEGKITKLDKKRKAEMAYVDSIADNFAGTAVHVYESYVGADGKRYFRDNNGVKHKAPNGKYINGEIWLDINSGDNGEGMMLNTFAHEMYHHIEKFNKEKANELASFVSRELGIENVEAAVQDQITKARAAGYGEDYFKKQGMTDIQATNEVYSRAMSDFVADSLETMFTRGNPAEAISKLKTENRGLFDEIKSFIDKWVSKLKKFYQDKTISMEGEMVSQLKTFEELQQLFMEAMQGAGENYRAALENAEPAVAGAEMSNEEAFLDSATAVHFQIRPPYADGSKAFNAFVDDLNPEARKTFDLFYGFYQRSRITNTVSVSGKKVKAVNISALYLLAQDWNDMLAKEPKWAAAAKDLADFLPADVRKRMNMNEDGTLNPTTMEKEFKMPSSMAQRLVDALPYESIEATYKLGDKTVTMPEGKARQSVGGEAYRRAILDETRKMFSEGKLKPVGIGTMSKDRWGSLGFLAANGKTGASGDFTTVCPQMMFNRGCWYCYRRAAMEKGVNNKLVANNVWYTGEILRIKDKDIESLNKNGGLRIQSFGDWMPHFSAMLADVLYDAELRGLQVKIITKEPSMINYIAALRDQNVGKNLYFNLSADYTIEKGPAKQAQGGDSLDTVNPERPYMRDRNNNFWWKRAMTVEEAAKYREKYPWVNTRIVATDIAEFIRGLKDNRVDVVTGYHGNIRGIERIDSTTGAEKVEVEALGDAGMPRFAFNPTSGTWFTEYEGKTATHKRLAQAIADNGLQWEYYIKTCCITGRCATCEGKCGALARDFNVKNATNRDTQSVAYWQQQMEYAVEPEFGDLTEAFSLRNTDTEQFKKWFAESKVVNPDGSPKVMYHGTSSYGFSIFNTYGGKFGLFGRGSYFTDNADVAESYTKKGKGQTPGVYDVYLSIQNPIDMDAAANINEWERAFDSNDLDATYLNGIATNEDAFRALKENLQDEGYTRSEAEDLVTDLIEGMGYDGITHIGGGRYGTKDGPKHRVYIAFDPEQIKSASKNKGTYDPEHTNIYYSLRNEKPLTDREILAQIDPSKRNETERYFLGQYQDRLKEISEQEPRLAAIKKQMESLDPKKDKAKLSELRIEAGKIQRNVTYLKKKVRESEGFDMFKRMAKEERNNRSVQKYKEEQKQKIKAMQEEQRVLRNELTGTTKMVNSMEDEFIKLAKDYEAKKIDLKTMEEKYLDAGKQYSKDTEMWDREFSRLMKLYDDLSAKYSKDAGDAKKKIKRLEDTILRQRQTAKERVAGRRNTEMRHKIQKKVNELDQLLRHGSKHRNVPEFLQDSVAAVLQAINMEVRDGDQRRKTFEATLARYDRQIAMTSDPDKVSELIRKRNEYEAKGDQFANRMEMLQAAYKQIREENTGMELDEGIAAKLDSLFEVVGNTPLGQMNAAQLEAVNDILNVTQATIRNTNELLAEERSAGVVENSKSAMTEIRTIGGGAKKRTEVREEIEKFGWNNLKPVQAFEAIGSSVLNHLFKNLRSGEDTLAVDLQEGKNFFKNQWKKHNGDSWDTEKKWKFTSTSGKSFELDLNQIMSLYALAKRDQARDHLRVGGFTFDSQYKVKDEVKFGPVKIKAEVKNTDASAYNLSDEILGEIIGKLTADQRAFVDSMQDYLSDNMAAKGNEISLKKYGIRLFKDKNYFPLRVADQYMAKVREQQSGDRKLKNSGFTQAVTPNAKNPVVLSSFLEVWAEHVDEMSLYHSFVLPLDDLSRVLNYHDAYTEETAAGSVMEAIKTAYGEAAVNYIDNLIRDVNGGNRSDSAANFVNKWMSKAKKAQTMASLSVAIQQPSSILRAMSMINSSYFFGAKVTEKTHDRTWDEIKEYAPIAIIKEMGGYDTHVGKNTVDYLTDSTDYHGFGEKFKAFFTDGDFRDDAFGKLPELMDEMAWGVIWNAVKREQATKHPDVDVKSKAFMSLVADRFTDVITHTQVYDSVFSRSGLMRSKDGLVKMGTSFMAEPTTTANMLAMAVIQAKRGEISKAQAGRTVAAIAASLALNAALVSVVYALRDDDEDKRYDEKWLENFRNNFFESLNPAGYIPFIRDIDSMRKGFDIERTDMTLIGDLMNAIQGLENEDVTAWDKTLTVIGAVGDVLGVPMKNIIRDVRGIVQTAGFALDDKPNPRTKTGAYMARRGMDLNNGEEMILALQRGDMEHIQRVFGRYESQEKAESALQSAIGEKYRAGEMSAEEATQLLTDYFDREEYEVYWILDKWDYAVENGTSEGYSKYGVFLEAIENGGDYITEMQRYLEYGSEMADIRSAISGRYKKQYLEADEAGREEIRNKLTPVFLETDMYQSDIDKKFNDWNFEAEHDYTYSAYKAAYRDGEVTEQDLRNAMKFYGLKNFEIDKEIRSLNEDIEFHKKYDMTLGEMKDSYDNGDVAKNTMKNALVYSGMTATEAQDWIKKRDISNRLGIDYMELDDAYKAGDISRQTLYNAMIEAGSTKREADDAIVAYDWLKQNYKKYPDLAIGDAKKFVIKISDNDEEHTMADYGVTIDHYIQYAKLKPECKGVDANGDGKTDDGTLRDSIFRMIDSLPISDSEKDGLALISYGIKSIRKNAPWHKK